MADCIKEITVDYCLDLSSIGVMYENISYINKTMLALAKIVSQPDVKQTVKGIKEATGKIDASLGVMSSYNADNSNFLFEKKPLTSATETEIINYLKKSEALANHFSVLFKGTTKKNPFIAFRLNIQNDYIGLNQRNSITSINSKKGNVFLTAKDFISKANRTSINEAPKNDLYFLRSKDKWIPFFITPYIATTSTSGLSIYARNQYEEIRKLVTPSLFKSMMSPYEDSLLLSDIAGLSAGDHARKDRKWVKLTHTGIPNKSTDTVEGITNFTELLTPKKLSDELRKLNTIKDDENTAGANPTNKSYVLKDGKWVELDAGVPLKTFTPLPDAAAARAGKIKYASPNPPTSSIDALTPSTLTQTKGNPLLLIPDTPGNQYDFHYVKKDALALQAVSLASKTKAGYAQYSEDNDPTEATLAVQAKGIDERAKFSLANKPARFVSTANYGIKQVNGEYELVEVDGLLAIQPEATLAKAGLIKLGSYATVKDLLKLASNNLISRKIEKITGVRAGKLEFFEVSDYALYGNMNSRLPPPREHTVADSILKAKLAYHKKAPQTKQLLAAVTRTNNKVVIYSLEAEDGINKVIKKLEFSLNTQITQENLIELHLTPCLDYKGNELSNKWVLFITDSSSETVLMSVYVIEESNSVYTHRNQINAKELDVLSFDLKSNTMMQTYNQTDGVIELTVGNSSNIAVYKYYDIDQLELKKMSTSYLVQKIQPFSNIISSLVLSWAVRQTTGHYIYRYINDLRLGQGAFNIESIISLEDKILVAIDIGTTLTIEIYKKNNLIYKYGVADRLSFLKDGETIQSVRNNQDGDIAVITINRAKERRLLILNNDLEPKLEIPLNNTSAGKDSLFFDGGISLVSALGRRIIISVIKNKNVSRITDWKIAPDVPTEAEARTGDLYFIY